jgi:hypothetical protein
MNLARASSPLPSPPQVCGGEGEMAEVVIPGSAVGEEGVEKNLEK